MNKKKKEVSDFINVNVLIEHDDKDGFYLKGRKLDEENIYINKDFITEITTPKKQEVYVYTYSNSYERKNISYFSVKIYDTKYYLKEIEFEKFKDIL